MTGHRPIREGQILSGPLFNERRGAEDRRHCYWLVTNCNTSPELQEPVKDPAHFSWHEVRKVKHFWLEVDALTRPMQVREPSGSYGRTDA